MRITGLEVNGFGAWDNLQLTAIDDRVTVFYGPNEAGKTTLMQFARSMLYGLSSARRRRYIPPARGGRGGGVLTVGTPGGTFHIRRFANGDARYDECALVAPDGTLQSDHVLDAVLGGVDESIFNNVFAVGLREIQELGSLDDSEAARWLYDLSAGTDRVSLVDVMRDVTGAREQILASDGGPSQVPRLLAQREKLQAEIDRLVAEGQGCLRLLADREQVLRDIADCETESQQLLRESRVLELAVSVAERWQRRSEIDAQLAALGPAVQIPENALERLDRLAEEIARWQQKHRELTGRYQQLRKEVAALSLNENLLRVAPRIEALVEQTNWVNGLAAHIRQLDGDVASLEKEILSEHAHLGLASAAVSDNTVLANRTPDALQAAAKALRDAQRNVQRAREEIDQRAATSTSASAELEAALARRGQRDLNRAIEQAGALVTNLRRRIQLDEKSEQLKRDVGELEEKHKSLLHQQMMPPWPLMATGGVFVFGFVLLLIGIFLPWVLNMGWWLAALGLIGCGVASIAKISLEKQSAESLAACQKQLETVKQQVKQTADEAKQLDRQLPPSGGPWAVRLQAAQRELAELEGLLPLDSRMKSVGHDSSTAQQRLHQARVELRRAKSRWQGALTAAGLPAELKMAQVRRLLDRREQVADLRRRLQLRKEELAQRHQEFQALTTRVRQLATDAGVAVRDESPVDTIARLVADLRAQQAQVDRRNSVSDQARQARKQAARAARQVRGYERQRREMFTAVGAANEEEYRRFAQSYTQIVALRKERAMVHAEVTAALAGHDSELAVARLMIDHTPPQLETKWQHVKERQAALDERLKQLYLLRGEAQAQIKAAASDQRLAQAQLDLGCVEQQLHDALEKWQTLAVANRILDAMRRQYEADRQPETLTEATKYLRQMTEGRYRRVWTPLTERVLRVEDASGQSLPVEVLSSGTREQLFLSLRLAMVALYARRGIVLPLILDDVLVNFDAQRAKAAARVLCEFAAAGHQLLLFTCHQHIAEAFRGLGADVRRLPSANDDLAHGELPLSAAELISIKPPAVKAMEPPAPLISPVLPPLAARRPTAPPVVPPPVLEPIADATPVVIPTPSLGSTFTDRRPTPAVAVEPPLKHPAPPTKRRRQRRLPPPTARPTTVLPTDAGPSKPARLPQRVVARWKPQRWDPAIEVPIEDADDEPRRIVLPIVDCPTEAPHEAIPSPVDELPPLWLRADEAPHEDENPPSDAELSWPYELSEVWKEDAAAA